MAKVKKPSRAAGRTARVVFYVDRGGSWRWRLKGANNRTLADGAEGYTSLWHAERGFAGVMRALCEAEVVRVGARGMSFSLRG
jgi:uncharacterized protein YegP (UPF0339 family)